MTTITQIKQLTFAILSFHRDGQYHIHDATIALSPTMSLDANIALLIMTWYEDIFKAAEETQHLPEVDFLSFGCDAINFAYCHPVSNMEDWLPHNIGRFQAIEENHENAGYTSF